MHVSATAHATRSRTAPARRSTISPPTSRQLKDSITHTATMTNSELRQVRLPLYAFLVVMTKNLENFTRSHPRDQARFLRKINTAFIRVQEGVVTMVSELREEFSAWLTAVHRKLAFELTCDLLGTTQRFGMKLPMETMREHNELTTKYPRTEVEDDVIIAKAAMVVDSLSPRVKAKAATVRLAEPTVEETLDQLRSFQVN